MWAWVQNEDAQVVGYWRARGAWDGDGTLERHVFRKGYQARRWHTDEVIEGFPRGTDWQSAAELADRGVVGLYARRRQP
jgi:hypothetical protein